MRPGRDVVTRVRRSATGVDPYGNDVTTEQRTEIDGCNIQPDDSSEVLGSADRVTTRYLLHTPGSADLTATDAIEWGGITFEVDGDPLPWRFTGRAHHLQVYLKRWTG
jgi:hypothetical protein